LKPLKETLREFNILKAFNPKKHLASGKIKRKLEIRQGYISHEYYFRA